ncbi:MAG: 50S ribosomal protein L19e [Euryarchaeota archaeon]|nr:50S ribosomal protein L19e [Euryarchaeota archaeon]
MMQVTNQKRMAADILSKQEGKQVGLNRVWIHPAYIDQVATAVQKEEIRELIEEGIIRSKPIKGTSRVRARLANNQKSKGRRKGQGSRSGSKNARTPRKQLWMKKIRSQRRTLKEMRENDLISASRYRYYYRKAKGGTYRSVAHMKTYLEAEGIESEGGES